MKRAEEQRRISAPISIVDREFDLFHEIPISSQSSGHEFVLHIQLQYSVEAEIGQHFNGYGFASNQQWRGTVPFITCCPYFRWEVASLIKSTGYDMIEKKGLLYESDGSLCISVGYGLLLIVYCRIGS